MNVFCGGIFGGVWTAPVAGAGLRPIGAKQIAGEAYQLVWATMPRCRPRNSDTHLPDYATKI